MKTIANAFFTDYTFSMRSAVVKKPEDLVGYDLLVLHGGEDISPSIYGEKVRTAHAPEEPSTRDMYEIALARKALELKIPILGICRGAQLMCCLLGGKLYQDVPEHTHGTHKLILPQDPNRTIISNTCHHQMMIPKNGVLLAHTGLHRAARFKETEYVTEDIFEPEVVFWGEHKTLAVQGHPEWDRSGNKDGIYSFIREKLNELFEV